MRRTQRGTHDRGQVLVLFVGGMIGLLAIAALAIDLSSVYSAKQTDRAAADAAALAGAQELQQAGTRTVGASDQVDARRIALENLAGRFGVSPVPTGAGCSPSGAIVNCALTPDLLTSISSPSKTTGNPRSVQVTVHDPDFPLTFTRLFGQNGWDVGETSVALIDYGGKYAIITLQPPSPKPNGTDANLCKNLVVSGNGTILNVVRGDIGSNTSAATTLKGEITLADGFLIHHIDDIPIGGCSVTTPNATWSQSLGLPEGKHIGPTPLIQDPDYYVAKFSGAPAFTNADDPTAKAGTDLASCAALPGFPTDAATVAFLTPPSGGTLTCYKPGIYSAKFSLTSDKDVAYLMPGAYRFDGGMKLGAKLAGGMTTGAGVVLVFPQSETLDPNNTVAFFLNTGNVSCGSDGCRAAPAVDFANKEVKTPAGLSIAIEVPRTSACFSGTNPLNVSSCDGNNTVTLGGSGLLKVAGAIYAPSDNIAVAGNSSTTGYVGQMIGWTVKYSGQGRLDQDYPGGPGNGVLRLDTACSGMNTPCIP